MKLHFSLMVQPTLDPKAITGVLAHPKAFGACKDHIRALGSWYGGSS